MVLFRVSSIPISAASHTLPHVELKQKEMSRSGPCAICKSSNSSRCFHEHKFLKGPSFSNVVGRDIRSTSIPSKLADLDDGIQNTDFQGNGRFDWIGSDASAVGIWRKSATKADVCRLLVMIWLRADRSSESQRESW
jgi:hypothetical protein